MSAKMTGHVIALLALCLATIGCSGRESDVIARVGNYEITALEMDDMLTRVSFPDATFDDELTYKRAKLDTMINQRLLILGAYEHGIDRDQEIARVVLANQQQFLLDVLFLREIADKVTVTESEIREFYDNLEFVHRASQIVLKTEADAQAMVDRLIAGENFEQLAYEYSIDPAARRTRGDIGYFEYDAAIPALASAVVQMEVGEISPPIETRLGWHVVRLDDREENSNRGEYDKVKRQLYQRLQSTKIGQRTEEYFTELQGRYQLTVDTNTVNYLMHKRARIYPPQVLAGMSKGDFDLTQLDRNERELPLVTWGAGQLTVGSYFERIADHPVRARPDLDDYEALESFAFQIVQTDILAYEASVAGLQDDPIYTRKLRLFRELNMAAVMRNDTIPASLDMVIPDSMVRAYYQENIERFTEPARIRVYEIHVSDEMLARRLRREIKSIEQFREKAVEYTERPSYRNTNGDLGFIEREWLPELFDAAWNTPSGQLMGPVVVEGKYSICWVGERQGPTVIDYLDVKRNIVPMMVEEKRQEGVDIWLQQRKQSTAIEVFDDALERAIRERRDNMIA